MLSGPASASVASISLPPDKSKAPGVGSSGAVGGSPASSSLPPEISGALAAVAGDLTAAEAWWAAAGLVKAPESTCADDKSLSGVSCMMPRLASGWQELIAAAPVPHTGLIKTCGAFLSACHRLFLVEECRSAS